jgi:hypothetical protein
MDINKMLAEMRAEREQVEQAILVLERWRLDGVSAGAVHRSG